MDINKLTSHVNGKLEGASPAESSSKTAESSSHKKEEGVSDKVSLKNYNSRKNEKLFAEIELEKLNQASFKRLKGLKAQIVEYEKAKETSPEAANDTNIGKMLNDPDVWSKIAEQMVNK